MLFLFVLYPRTPAWRCHETAQIKSNASLSGAEQQALMRQLLAKQTKLLQTIDRLKIVAARENREAKINEQLTKVQFHNLFIQYTLWAPSSS